MAGKKSKVWVDKQTLWKHLGKIRKPIPIHQVMPLQTDEESLDDSENGSDFDDWQMPEPA